MPEDKNFLNGFIIKEYEFDNGGTELKVSVLVEDFIKSLRSAETNGWANLIIKRRKEPSEKGVTHYIFENPWKPEQQNTTSTYSSPSQADDDDELPF